MASDIKKVEIGPAKIEFGEGADQVIFETTIGGVNLTVETNYRELKIDQTGDTVRSKWITGRNVKMTIPFAEYDLSVIPRIMVGAELIKGPKGQKVQIQTGVGMDLLAKARKVVVKPVAAKNDASKWITIPLAYPETELQYNYDNNKERITNVTLSATPDENDMILILGDVTVVAG